MNNIKNTINDMTDDMLNCIGRLVKYNSVEAEALPGMPFGKAAADVLNEALEMAAGMGFETVNLDNYCGYAEIGQGSDIIGIVAHLDIVPAGEGWNTDPFELTRVGDTVYGRGVSDDKGAAVASMYAMKLIKESGIELNKRVRLIFGCNEENGSKCMEHYNEVAEPITAGFTPDGEFPGIHGEKGMLIMAASSKNTKIIDIKGGFVGNAVSNHCVTKVSSEDVDINALNKALGETELESFSVTEENGVITIDAVGVAAHASTPLLGVNANGCTFKALQEAGMKDDFVEYYNSHIGTACNGEGYNINISDEFGNLTLNNGIVSMTDGVIKCTIDCRVPVTFNETDTRSRLESRLEDEKGCTKVIAFVDPLFYPADSVLVKSLYDAYVEVTGDTKYKPMVIGGGTYAKHIPGIIAFGCQFMDTDNHIHDANEKLDINELKLQVEIYVNAVKKLLEM